MIMATFLGGLEFLLLAMNMGQEVVWSRPTHVVAENQTLADGSPAWAWPRDSPSKSSLPT